MQYILVFQLPYNNNIHQYPHMMDNVLYPDSQGIQILLNPVFFHDILDIYHFDNILLWAFHQYIWYNFLYIFHNHYTPYNNNIPYPDIQDMQ